jgi:hypothetical protein
MHIQESASSSGLVSDWHPIVRRLEDGLTEELDIPGFRLAEKKPLARYSAACEPVPLWVLIYENDDRSVRLHVRIAYAESEMCDDWLTWDFAPEAEEDLYPQTELVILTYRNFIVNILQRADGAADHRTTQSAASSVNKALRKYYLDH